MVSAVARRLSQQNKLRRDQTRIGPEVGPALGDEVYYRKKLLRQINALIETTERSLKDRDINVLQDSVMDQSPRQQVKVVAKDLRKTARVFNKRAEATAKAYVRRVDKNQRSKFFNQMKSQFGIDVNKLFEQRGDIRETLEAKTQENVGLIKTISSKYLEQVEATLNRHLTSGTPGTLVQDLAKIKRDARSNVKLIARDQTNKMYGALNQARQQALGIEEYVWVTARDGERVRPSHRSKDGKTFRWDKPPPDTGHPGEDIQCRCIARPVIKV